MEHDSHEFLLHLLNKLKDELTEKGAKLPSNTDVSVGRLWRLYSEQFPS